MTVNMCELNELELNRVAGGNMFIKEDRPEYYYNSANDLIGYKLGMKKNIQFVPCDKCGKPMHKGCSGWCCDPCDRHLVFVTTYPWNGTADSLIAAAG